MMSGRFRAWRFVHPEYDRPSAGRGGLRVSPTGRVDMVEGDESIRQAILLLISTIPGERVMRPAYGCHIHRLMFSPNDDTTAGLAIHYVRQALEQWEPRIDILDLDAYRNMDDPGVLNVTLEYRVKLSRSVDRISFLTSLNAEGT